MMLKKILSFALALLIVGSMVACNNNKNPGGEDPDTENPGTEQPGNDNPGTEQPGGENPGNENPGNENPGNENPGNENPGTEQPGDENPGNDNPGTEQPGVNVPQAPTFTEVNEKVYALVTVELRTEPAADAANVKGELRVNEVVTRIGVSEDGEWSKIRYEAAGLEGDYYVASNCLSLYNGTGEPEGPNDDPVTPPVTTPDDNEFVTITPSEYVYVTTDALNLRKAPSMNGEIVTQLAFGTKLERVAKNAAGWSVVVYNGTQYYLSSDYVTTDDVTGSSFRALEQAANKTVTAYTLKIRTSPWMDPSDENVMGYLAKGDVVKCVAISPDGAWYRIEYTDGKYYYVGAKYLSGYVTPSTPTNPEPPNTNPTVTFTQLAAPTLMYAINKTGGVRVYSTPDTLTTAVTTLTVGTAVYCTEISTDEVWFKVTLAGQPDTYYYVLVADLQTGGK